MPSKAARAADFHLKEKNDVAPYYDVLVFFQRIHARAAREVETRIVRHRSTERFQKVWFLSAGSEHQKRLQRLSYYLPPPTSS
jgi:hypothetical protein